jgi:hypothetical protein
MCPSHHIYNLTVANIAGFDLMQHLMTESNGHICSSHAALPRNSNCMVLVRMNTDAGVTLS